MARIPSPTRGAFIRKRLKASVHTQQDLANYLEVSIGRAHKILRGDDLLVSEALAVCRYLSIFHGDLLWTHAPELRPTLERLE